MNDIKMDLIVDKNNNSSNSDNSTSNGTVTDVNLRESSNLVNSNVTSSSSGTLETTGDTVAAVASNNSSEVTSTDNLSTGNTGAAVNVFGNSNSNDSCDQHHHHNNTDVSLSPVKPMKQNNRRTGHSVRIKLEPSIGYCENMQKVPSMSDLLEESSLGEFIICVSFHAFIHTHTHHNACH